ncbi:MAG: ribonuclease J [Actinomycetota bacterium]
MSAARSNGSVRVVFLGGLGEVGRNMMAIEAAGRILVVDCGLSFPNEEMLGVDLVLPDFTWVVERADRVEAVLLTHGHEDHVGALSWFLQQVDVPVYGTPLTLGIAGRRLSEFDVKADMRAVAAPGSLELGPFKCRFFTVSHSIPDAMAVALDTPGGRIFYTGDFKLDPSPIDGRHTDLEGLAEMGREGVDLMLSDSTNAETPGRTPSESIVGDALRDVFTGSSGRIIVACFASNLHRIQQVCELSESNDRKVAFVGRSMLANADVGQELGHLRVDPKTIVELDKIEQYRPEEITIICTGSQGEPLSALSLIASGEHKHIRLRSNDTVILSASPIPGNESAVHRVLNELFRVGADVYHSGIARVHVSGHGASEELQEMASLIRPRHLVPVHGEYRQLATHRKLAEAVGFASDQITIVEDGDTLELRNGVTIRGERVRAGMVLVDGLGVGDVGPVVLRDRKHLAEDGILICVVTIDAQSGELLAGPDLISRGFVHIDESRELLEDATDRVQDALEALEAEHVTDWGAIKKVCRRSLGEFVWRETRRRPVILPVIQEV